MFPIGAFAVAVGVTVLVLIAVISMRGPRDRGGRLPPVGGPVLPGPHWGDDGDFGGDG
jgi:hypothetical protein